jgi:hypothetical protein
VTPGVDQESDKEYDESEGRHKTGANLARVTLLRSQFAWVPAAKLPEHQKDTKSYEVGFD